MKIELNKEDIKDLIAKDYLAEQIAEQIIRKNTDYKWNEFDKALLEAVKKASEKIVLEMLEDYFLENNIKQNIQKILHAMTKEEVIEHLKK